VSFRIGEARLLIKGEPLYGVYLLTVAIIKSGLTLVSASLPAKAHDQNHADNGGHDHDHDYNRDHDGHSGRQTAS